MEGLLGWDTAGGIGVLLAGLGVFFWGLQFTTRNMWQRSRWSKDDGSKK